MVIAVSIQSTCNTDHRYSCDGLPLTAIRGPNALEILNATAGEAPPIQPHLARQTVNPFTTNGRKMAMDETNVNDTMENNGIDDDSLCGWPDEGGIIRQTGATQRREGGGFQGDHQGAEHNFTDTGPDVVETAPLISSLREEQQVSRDTGVGIDGFCKPDSVAITAATITSIRYKKSVKHMSMICIIGFIMVLTPMVLKIVSNINSNDLRLNITRMNFSMDTTLL